MIAAWGSAGTMMLGAALVLPWAFGNTSTRSWRSAGWGMILLVVGLVALILVGLTITKGNR